MAYYTDYETTVPYDTSAGITNSAVCNAIANILVTYCGWTLVANANTSVNSSDSNYAEIKRDGTHIRLYSASATEGSAIYARVYLDDGTDTTTYISVSLPYIAFTSVRVRIRSWDTLTGASTMIMSIASSFDHFLHTIKTVKISDGTVQYATTVGTPSANEYSVIDDGSARIRYYASNNDAYDHDAGKQVLTSLKFGPSSGSAERDTLYLSTDVYFSSVYLETGIVSVVTEAATRYFYINGFAFELNAPA